MKFFKKLITIIFTTAVLLACFPSCIFSAQMVGTYRFYEYRTYSATPKNGSVEDWDLIEEDFVGDSIACIGTCSSGMYMLQKDTFILDLNADGTCLWRATHLLPDVPIDGGVFGTWSWRWGKVVFAFKDKPSVTARLAEGGLVFTMGSSILYKYETVLKKETMPKNELIATGCYATQTVTHDGVDMQKTAEYYALSLYADGTGCVVGDSLLGLSGGMICRWTETEDSVSVVYDGKTTVFALDGKMLTGVLNNGSTVVLQKR